MGVYIKDMEMPTSCAFCRFSGAYCYAKGDEDAHSTLPCPLIPIQPHGKLIDASKIGLTDFEIILCQKGNPFKNALEMLLEKIEKAPTIIPASEEGET